MKISKIGLDLAKNVFHLVGLNENNKVVLRKKLKRPKLLPYFANLDCKRIGMEACASSHYWARELKELGFEVSLLPAQLVKPLVQGAKNDYNDALAIAEALDRPNIHPVRPKTVEEQDLQSLERMRTHVVEQRTAIVNQLRGLLGEYGLIIPKGVHKFRAALPFILEDGENGLTDLFRQHLARGYRQLQELDAHIAYYDEQIKIAAKANEQAKLLMTIPGFGPVNSSAFISAIGDGSSFKRGRDVSAFLGLVPGQHTSGDKPVLLGITKRGNTHLRTVLIHGARAVVGQAHKKDDPTSRWVTNLIERRGKGRAIVALANKMARIGWAVVTSGQPYRLEAA